MPQPHVCVPGIFKYSPGSEAHHDSQVVLSENAYAMDFCSRAVQAPLNPKPPFTAANSTQRLLKARFGPESLGDQGLGGVQGLGFRVWGVVVRNGATQNSGHRQ